MSAGRSTEVDLTNTAEEPSVSVVVPCYRCKATIGRALDSIRRQTIPPLEVVLVDDASRDGTVELLREISEKLQAPFRVRLIELTVNVGAAQARNAGWDAAKGRYVAFLDADASWHADKLKIQHAYMESHPEVMVSGHGHAVTKSVLAEAAGALAAEPVSFRQLLWRNRFITSSAMVRRSLHLRFPDGQRHMEDHRLWLDVARAGHPISRLRSVLAAHHKPDYGASGLSADLLAMEKAELANYRAMLEAGAICAAMRALLSIWSLGKFARRLVVVGLRRAGAARDT